MVTGFISAVRKPPAVNWHMAEAIGYEPGMRMERANAFSFVGANPQKVLAAMRVVFGFAFLLDGLLKWVLFAQGNMQATIAGMTIAPSFIVSNWVFFGVMVGLGETFGGLFLILGIFQRPAAAWSMVIMFSIWLLGGLGGWYDPSAGWVTAGQTDLGGDLMLMLVFLFLVFVPTSAYSLSQRLRLPERLASGNTFKDRFVRTVVS